MSDGATAHALRLVADVGGTNTRVGLCRGNTLLPDTVKKYRNTGFRNFECVVAAYRADMPSIDCSSAVIAVAGPVEDGCASMTNLGWQFDEQTLLAKTGIEHVHLINDLQAQGYAIDGLSPNDIRRVIDGKGVEAKWPALVVGIGTGLNATVVYEIRSGLFATASECGHVRLSLRQSETAALADATGFVSMEDAVSGRGLSRLHAALHHLADAGCPTGTEIVTAAIGGDSLAVRTMGLFLEVLGDFIGDLALIHLPFGGIYISGGVGRAIAPLIETSGLEASFRNKGRFKNLMQRFSVDLLLDDYAALKGAGWISSSFCQRESA